MHIQLNTYSVEPQDILCAAQNSVLCADMLSEATQETLTQIRVINTEDTKPIFSLSMQDGYEVLSQLVAILHNGSCTREIDYSNLQGSWLYPSR